MPRFSKRANLLKDLEAVAKSHMIKAYLRFYLMGLEEVEELDHCGGMCKRWDQLLAYLVEIR